MIAYGSEILGEGRRIFCCSNTQVLSRITLHPVLSGMVETTNASFSPIEAGEFRHSALKSMVLRNVPRAGARG